MKLSSALDTRLCGDLDFGYGDSRGVVLLWDVGMGCISIGVGGLRWWLSVDNDDDQ